MVTVWVVGGVLALGAAGLTVVVRRQSRSVEPTVREFAEFRDAISRQVAGLPTTSGNAPRRRHLARGTERDGLDQTRH
ncbi:MAG TPA: hypothetical protein VGA11_00580 [Acidimicrobiia bacterium]